MTLAFAPERIETLPLARLQPYAKKANAATLARSTPRSKAPRPPQIRVGPDQCRGQSASCMRFIDHYICIPLHFRRKD